MPLRPLPYALLLAATVVVCQQAWAQGFLDRLEQRLDQQNSPSEPAAGQPSEPGYLGLVGDDLRDGEGVEVLLVRGGSPAEAAGLKPGDVIVALNGQPVRQLDDMAAVLGKLAAGQRAEFQVRREAERQRIGVTLGRRPMTAPRFGAPAEIAESLPSPPAVVDNRAVLGVAVTPVTEEARLRYGLTVRRGAVISSIRRGSPAQRYGLPLGGVIVAMDGRRVDGPDDLVEAIRMARPGQNVELSYYQGNQLFRKSVRLSPEAPVVPGGAAEPAARPDLELRLGGDGRRPLLGRIGRVVDEILDAEAPPAAAAAPSGGEADQVAVLKTELDRMRQQIDELTRRVSQLEKQLREAKTSPTPPPDQP